MLQNAKVTAFTVSELLRENQQGVKLPPHPHIRIKTISLFERARKEFGGLTKNHKY